MVTLEQLERASRYVDDELDATERRAFEAELARDPALARAVASMRALSALAPGLRPEPLAQDERVAKEVLERALRRTRARRAAVWASSAGAVAASVVIIVVAMTLRLQPAGPPATTSGAASSIAGLAPYPGARFAPGTRALLAGTVLVEGEQVELSAGGVQLAVSGRSIVTLEPSRLLEHVTPASLNEEADVMSDLKSWLSGNTALKSGLLVWVLSGSALARPDGGAPVQLSKGAIWTPHPSAAPAVATGSSPKEGSRPGPGRSAQALEGGGLAAYAPVIGEATQSLYPELVSCLEADLLGDGGVRELSLSLRLDLKRRGGRAEVSDVVMGSVPPLGAPSYECGNRLFKGFTPPAPPEERVFAELMLHAGVSEGRVVVTERRPPRVFSGRVIVDIGDAPSFGPKDAKVTVVEFSDLQCPFCARSHESIAALQRKYGHEVRFAFKQLPLRFHAHARMLAAAALAAARQDKYLELTDLVYERKATTRDEVRAIARELKLDLPRFEADLGSSAVEAQIDRDLAEAARLGISAAPTYVIDGETIVGARPTEIFEARILDALGRGRGRTK